MRFGVYTAILHDRGLPEALTAIRDLGLDAAEINVGGFLPPVHMPSIDDILTSDAARDDYLETFAEAGSPWPVSTPTATPSTRIPRSVRPPVPTSNAPSTSPPASGRRAW